MSPQNEARAYCLSIGLDPDEKVVGRMFGQSYQIRPRYVWYLGARPGQ